MREQFAVIFVCLIVALTACSVAAFFSHKTIGKAVSFLTAAFLPPIVGNLILTISEERSLSFLGSYIYYIGMDMVMVAMINFTIKYCNLDEKYVKTRIVAYLFLLGDAVQLMCNNFFGHAFSNEKIIVDDAPYYRLVPYFGQTVHRIIVYGALAGVIAIFLVKRKRTPRIYAARYSVILATLVAGALWQTYYIFSRTPVDRSMIGFGVFCLFIFYFSLYYRPLRLLDRMLANVASESPDALFFFEANNRCIWMNKPAEELVGVDDKDSDRVNDILKELFGEISFSLALWTSRQVVGSGDNERYYFLETNSVTDDKCRVAGSFLRVRDNTEEERKLRQEMYAATHDALTGLYSREYMCARIADILESQPDTPYYIVFADVKNFKIVNDIFSPAFGDYALKRIAALLRETFSNDCIYGRFGGDSFGILVPVREFDRDRIEAKLQTFVVEDGAIRHHLFIRVGVYEIVKGDSDVSVMFDRAHLAISAIQNEYNSHVAFYDAKMRDKALWDQEISALLPEALANMEIRPYLQPIADPDGNIVGAEALARWISPDAGFLSPGAFIPVFEKNGLIVELDKHMWKCACEILASWKDIRPDLFISVNISPKDFYYANVADEINALVKRYGVDPARLRLEITETVMMTDVENKLEVVNKLRESGFVVEMDDFGSGYSSLNMLKDMPVDVLKIDMKFLGKSENKDKAKAIVRNIIHLSADIGVESLTEGVETQEQFDALMKMGCRMFQGYYFSKPAPLEEFEEKYVKKK